MRAVQLIAHGKPGTFEVRSVPDPVAAPGEVVVEVRACGLNHLDLWLEEDGLPIHPALPRTPGGEIAGVVSEVGSDVPDWTIGDRVAVQSNLFCGACEFCARGEESLCLRGELLGVHRDGGFAERVSVPARALVALPDGVDYVASAALTLAGSTAMHMLTDRTTVREGDWVLVMGGASGVGSAAIQIARGLGAMVISTGSNSEKRACATALGAHHVVDTSDPDWPRAVRRLTDKRGVDLVIEHVGGKVFESLFGCLARGGSIVTCGATIGSKVTLDLWPIFVKQQKIIGSYGRSRCDMAKTLEWAAAGKIKPVVDRVLPLERTAEAFSLLRQRAVQGKLVIEVPVRDT